jgi:hypothetical protein
MKHWLFGEANSAGHQRSSCRRKVHVHDLHATLLKLIGFDHEKFTCRCAGRYFRLTPVHGTVVDELIG